MKLKTRIFLASTAGGLMALAGTAALAAAAVTPTVTATVQNSSNVNITSALVGSSVHAAVTVASSSAPASPTGTVDFNLYANQTCTGSPLAQTGVALVNGSASSSNTILTAAGLSYKVHYSGQTDLYTEADSTCASIQAAQVAPAISLSLSNNNVQAGSFVYGIPNLTGETATASGTLQYNVYSNNTCSTLTLNAGQKAVTNGSTPNSDSFQFNTPGTYYWRVAYSGDLNNTATTSVCGTVLTVVATSTPPLPPTGAGTISGTVFNDLNRDRDQDAGEPGISGVTIRLQQKATTTARWWKESKKYRKLIIATTTTDSNGNYSFANLGAGTYVVEQKELEGWKQRSSDRRRVVLDSTHTSADVDFANVEKKDKDKDDKDKEHEGKGKDKDDDWHDNGKHRGWERFIGNLNILNFDGWIRWNR
ncbi:MAG: hypothetical protein G01um101456_698 [Parcubacteria group bacterium Gr01-1014_56]|nr:MAG: hypothetical protein G01um101456_698 [Parcubacteria group bacterium Gr01-1014_56]